MSRDPLWLRVSASVPALAARTSEDRQIGVTAWTSACDDILAGMVRDQIADLDAKTTSLATSKDALAQFLADAAPTLSSRVRS